MNNFIIKSISALVSVVKEEVIRKSMFLCLVLLFIIICQISYAENETDTPKEKSSVDITVDSYSQESSSAVSEQDRTADWEYFFKKINVDNNDMYMRLFEALNYRDYDITEFVKDMDKYGSDPILWLARKNASSGRLTIAEKTVKTVISAKKFPEGLPYAYELLGNIKLAQKKPEEASSAYKLAIKEGNKKMYPNLAFASIAAGDLQTVKGLIPKLMEIKNEDTSALETLIAFSRISNDEKLFRESIEGVSESNLATNPRVFLNVLTWLYKTGDSVDLLMADRLQRTYPKLLEEAIELLQKSGKPGDLKLAVIFQEKLNIMEANKGSGLAF
jgi:tetratricopeptide (TPR) repeat protein